MGFHVRMFDNPVHPSFLCKICDEVLEDPMVLACCGRLVCFSCLKKKDALACPCCTSASFQSVVCHQLASYLQDLTVACEQPIDESSCEGVRCGWRGRLSDIALHKEHQCPYQKISCPFGTTCYTASNCSSLLLRKDLPTHIIHHHATPKHQHTETPSLVPSSNTSCHTNSITDQVVETQNKTNFLLAHMIKAVDGLSRNVKSMSLPNSTESSQASHRTYIKDDSQKTEHLTPSKEKLALKIEASASPPKAMTALSPLTRLKHSVSQSRLLKAHFARRNRVVEESTSNNFLPEGEDKSQDLVK